MSLIENDVANVNGLTDTPDVSTVLFGIKERPLVYFENGGPAVETEYKVLLNEKTNGVLYTGKIYSPVHNSVIVDALSDFKELKLAKVRNYYGKRFEFTYTMPDTMFQLGPEETMLSLNIMNSYDGTSSLHVVGGLYVLVCSNRAKVGRLTYQFKRKHTSVIGRNEIAGFIQDSILYVKDKIQNVADKDWSNDEFLIKKQFLELTKVFPPRKDNQLHPCVATINAEYIQLAAKYYDQREFALFMAATNITTRPQQYGLGSTYTKALDNAVSDVFFG